MRLIDADTLGVLTVIGGRMDGKVEFAKVIEEMIKKAPTVDAVPVRHGKWIQVGHIEHMQIVYRCSACNGQTIVDGNFCPNCGARMDGERKEE